MRFRRFFFPLAFSLVLGPVAFAQEKRTDAELEVAKKRFALAEALEAKGDWPGALEALQQTAAITMTPGIRYHIAYCQERMGHLLDASRSYALAQREARASRGRAAESVLALADQRFADVAARIPRVTLRLRPSFPREQVKVLVDRHPVAMLPSGTFGVDPGAHELEVSATGFASVLLPLRIGEKELRDIEVALVPAHPPAAAASSEKRSTTTESRDPAKVRVFAIVATSAAAAMAGLGVGAYALASASHDDGKVACAGQTGPCDDLKTSVRTLDALALGAWIGAAALGVTATLLWLAPSRGETKARAHLSLGPGRAAFGYAF